MINRSHILATALLILVCCDDLSLAKRLVKRDFPQQRIPDQERFNFFDLELLQSVTAANQGNVLISPVSVKATLALILEGAGGRSAEQIRSALRLPENPAATQTVLHTYLSSLLTEHPGYRVALSNRVFMSKALYPNQRYVSTLRQHYYADVEKVDFGTPENTAMQINTWIREITHGLIQQLVEPANLNPEAQVVLANAIYFKGKWQTQFDTQGTTPRCFFSTPGYCRNANMMETLGEYGYAYVKRLDAYALELPYQGNKFSMVIVMPNAVDGITQLVRDVLHVPLQDIVNQLQTSEVLVSVPRFKVEFSIDLVSNLRAMGIRDIFGSGSNLTGLFSGGEAGQISNVFHKAKIVVNEEGSEAAAGTGAQVIPLMGSSIPKFRADRPFLFFIRDITTGVVLFSGRVSEPEFTKKPQENIDENIAEILTSPRPAPPPRRTTRPPNRRTTVRTTTQGMDTIGTYSGYDTQSKPSFSYAQAAANTPKPATSQNSNSQNYPIVNAQYPPNSNSQYPQHVNAQYPQNSNSQQSSNANIQPNHQQQYNPHSQGSSSQQNPNGQGTYQQHGTNGENNNQQMPSRPAIADSSQIHFPATGTDNAGLPGTQTNQNTGTQYTSPTSVAAPVPLSLPDTYQHASRQNVAPRIGIYSNSRNTQQAQNQFPQNSNAQTASQHRDNEYVNNQNTRRVNTDYEIPISDTRTVVTIAQSLQQSYRPSRNDPFSTPFQASGAPGWQNARANPPQPDMSTDNRNYQQLQNKGQGYTGYAG